MRAGKYRHLITIQSIQSVTGKYGNNDSVLQSIGKAWAQVTAKSGAELYTDAAFVNQTIYEIKMRYVNGITNKHNVIYNGMTLNIESIFDKTGRRQELILTCSHHA